MSLIVRSNSNLLLKVMQGLACRIKFTPSKTCLMLQAQMFFVYSPGFPLKLIKEPQLMR